ncbi:MAG: ABC transporter ATP-binding protein [Alphaproteobacteria bacterium]
MHLIIARIFTFDIWWVHQFMHLIVLVVPFGFALLILYWSLSLLRQWRGRRPSVSSALQDHPGLSAQGLITGVFRYVFRHTGRDQMLIVAIALLSMPILYATLELPKKIINDAINAEQFPIDVFGVALSQIGYLFLLCSLFLFMLSLSCGMKYWINVYKGRVAESLICRMRLQLYRSWRSDASRGDGPALIPVVVQEVEPVGGFAGQALAVPVLEGGTFLTILLFMMIQDPILGSAAILLLPVQLAIVPRLQRRINRLARRRAKEVRVLGGLIVQPDPSPDLEEEPIIDTLQRIKKIRFDIHRRKFFMKSLNNFISHMTPFFFYAIGGYLVIQERLTFGALVAVIAAHKDFTPPLKELFGYYQITEDVRVRYEEIRRFLMMQPEDGRSAGHAKSDRPAPTPADRISSAHQLAS